MPFSSLDVTSETEHQHLHGAVKATQIDDAKLNDNKARYYLDINLVLDQAVQSETQSLSHPIEKYCQPCPRLLGYLLSKICISDQRQAFKVPCSSRLTTQSLPFCTLLLALSRSKFMHTWC